METLEYFTQDKTDWPRGEWDNEPDKKQWKDEETGLPCLIVRSKATGSLCGYVGVGKKHPLYRKHYDGCSAKAAARYMRKLNMRMRLVAKYTAQGLDFREVNKKAGKKYLAKNPDRMSNVEVHGGLTFAGTCHDTGNHAIGICHVDPSGETVWWLGFDCAHYMDRMPRIEATARMAGYGGPVADGEYRNFAYVTAQVQSLARQLKAIK